METVLCGVGDIFHCVGLNNNRFINRLSGTHRVVRPDFNILVKIKSVLVFADFVDFF